MSENLKRNVITIFNLRIVIKYGDVGLRSSAQPTILKSATELNVIIIKNRESLKCRELS